MNALCHEVNHNIGYIIACVFPGSMTCQPSGPIIKKKPAQRSPSIIRRFKTKPADPKLLDGSLLALQEVYYPAAYTASYFRSARYLAIDLLALLRLLSSFCHSRVASLKTLHEVTKPIF